MVKRRKEKGQEEIGLYINIYIYIYIYIYVFRTYL